jgi:hypothetical protein
VRANQAPTTATALYISLYDRADAVIGNLLNLVVDDIVYLYEAALADHSVKYRVTAAITNNANQWVTIPVAVTVVAAAGFAPANNADVINTTPVKGEPGPTGPQGPQGVPGPSAITTRGDLAVGDATGVPVRLPIGASGHVLRSSNGTDPAWQAPPWMTNPMTAVGDVIKGGTAGAPQRLAIGSNGQVLTVASGTPAWQTPAAPGMANPMTAPGDVIVGDAAGVPVRLPIGANARLLYSNGVTPQWTGTPQIARVYVSAEAAVSNNASVQLTPIGGRQYIIETGGTGDSSPGSLSIWDITLSRCVLRIKDGQVFANIAGDGLRQIWIGGVDSGGAGFRTLITQNNPTG